MTTATKPTYSLTVIMNGETIRKRTADIGATLAALKPVWLHTEVYVTVQKGKQKIERRLSLINAKRVFQNDVNREVFVNNLLLV